MLDSGGTALVTGASGFVGSHLVEQLIERGVRVRALLRAGSSARWLPDSPLLTVERAALDDAASLRKLLAGVDYVFHLAAVTSAPAHGAYFSANTESTRVMLAAIEQAAPDARLIFCSSLAAVGPARGGRPMTERDEARPITPYGQSKLEAERVVSQSGLHSVIVRPPTVYGPRDRDILEMFRWASRGIAPVVGAHEQQLSMIHVHDLARGLADAASAPAGSLYFLTDGMIHTRSLLMDHIARAVARNPMRITIPIPVALALAHASSFTARLVGSKPLLTPERIRDFTETDWICDDTLARRELGFRSRVSIEQGLADTAQWYRDERWI
jgi:nucleoside-diphosphate-sugar epimerase